MHHKRSLLRFIGILVAIALLSSCSKKGGYTDDFKDFRGQSAATIFNTGEQYLAKRQYSKAAKQFEALDGIYPFGMYSRQGQLDQIYAYYMDGQMPEAAASAERYIDLYPQGRGVAYSYYMRGLSNLQQEGTWLSRRLGVSPASRDTSYLKSAYSDMAMVTQLYPNSKYAASAKWFMAAIRNSLAEHVMTVARYYYMRQAYLAAANRAGFIVKHFQGTDDTIPALEIMYKSYMALGLQQQANDAWRVLQVNAPALANKIRNNRKLKLS